MPDRIFGGFRRQGGKLKVLIGYDGSKESERALQGLTQAGLPSGTEALVATVTTLWPEAGPEALAGGPYGMQTGEIADHAIREAQDLAEKAVRKIKKLFPAWQVRPEAIVDRPAQGLLVKADTWNPDLIVVGSHGRTGIGKLVLGSVSLRILHHAKANVRISRTRTGRGKAAAVRILLGMDGSAGADCALAVVKSRDWPKGTAVRVVAVVDWRDLPSAILRAESAKLREKTSKSMRTWIESRVEEAVRTLSRKGLKATQAILLGDPRHALLKEAKAWKADCIFVGSRGLNAVDRFLIGSISSAVAARAPCSVEVVRKAGGWDRSKPE